MVYSKTKRGQYIQSITNHTHFLWLTSLVQLVQCKVPTIVDFKLYK